MDEMDIGEVAHELAVLGVAAARKRVVVVVVPLRPGLRQVAEEFVAEGPPFDPVALGIDRHEVYLTDDEAIFLFEGAHGLEGLERILAEREFWDVVPAWEHVAAAPPRIAALAFAWPA